MTFDELLKHINEMSKVQRQTEVCVFEEGSNRYIWPAGVRTTPDDQNRPFLEGIAARGERNFEFFKPLTVDKDVDRVQAHPTELDSEVPMEPDRVRAARRSALDGPAIDRRSMRQAGRSVKPKRKRKK